MICRNIYLADEDENDDADDEEDDVLVSDATRRRALTMNVQPSPAPEPLQKSQRQSLAAVPLSPSLSSPTSAQPEHSIGIPTTTTGTPPSVHATLST